MPAMRERSCCGVPNRTSSWWRRLPSCLLAARWTSRAERAVTRSGWQNTVGMRPVSISPRSRWPRRGGWPISVVTVDWINADLLQWTPVAGAFDLVIVFYLQLPAAQRRQVYRRMATGVAPGGTMLVVGHDLDNLAHGYG